MSARVCIGTSGWHYRHWSDGVFYPAGMKPSAWLTYYGQHFDSVEINNTFYRLPDRRVFEHWHDTTPANFTFAVKASRFITHVKKLVHPEEYVARFLERASGLGEKLHVVLFQVPPSWAFNQSRLEGVCDFLSRQQIVSGLHAALEVRRALALVLLSEGREVSSLCQRQARGSQPRMPGRAWRRGCKRYLRLL
jgi:uncharacterized protein YecE (DUF72 family)